MTRQECSFIGSVRIPALLCLSMVLSGCRPPPAAITVPADLKPREKALQKTATDDNPRFVDVASQAGLNVVTFGGGERKDHLLESVGTGAAFLDYDEDGRL